MGIQGLWTHPLKRVKQNGRVPLSTLRGKRIAVDISIWLYPILKLDEVVLCLSFKPPYRPFRLLHELEHRHSVLIQAGLTPTYVFDGKRHSMKNKAREDRDRPIAAANRWIHNFYAKARSGVPITDEERVEYLRKLKTVCRPNPIIINIVVEWMKSKSISFFCAPFEAEWQCVSLVQDGMADVILSADGDCVALGASKVVVFVGFSDYKCVFFDREQAFSSLRVAKYDMESNADYLPEMAAFLGCDYIDRVYGNGPDTVFKYRLPGFRDALDKKAYLESLPGMTDDIVDKFFCVANLYRYAPVLKQIDGVWSIQPLNPFPSPDKWAASIGFHSVSHPSDLLCMDQSRYGDAIEFKNCSFLTEEGAPLPVFQDPCINGTNKRLPRFARLDFETVPMSCIPSDVLHEFVSARRPFVLQLDCSRDKLEKAVKLFADTTILPLEQVPKTIRRWCRREMLESVGDSWNDSKCDITIRSLAPIDETDVNRFYPVGNEENRERARRLVDGGNVLARESLQYLLCRDRATQKPKILFQCDCVPHMKTKGVKSENIGDDAEFRSAYVVFLCFGYDETSVESRKVCPYPYSSCGCPEGRDFCSHMLALLMVMMLLQQRSTVDFNRAYARSPLSIQQRYFLIENLVRRDKAKRKRSHSNSATSSKTRRTPWYRKDR